MFRVKTMATRSERKRAPERLAAICKMVQKGLTVRHAGERLHVHHSTISQWRRELPDFDAAITAAEAEFIDSQIANIRAAGKRSWQASAWLLERKWPAFFSQPQIQLNMPNGQIQHDELSVILENLRNSPEARRLLPHLVKDLRPIIDIPTLPARTIDSEKTVEGRKITDGDSECHSTENRRAAP
jgi:hypothetical protein